MKVAIVTGAMGNLGRAVVKKFLAEEYKVIGTLMPGENVREPITDENFETVVVDLQKEDESKRFVENVVNNYGNIDAAILTAGGFAMADISGTSTADILQQYRLNFETAYNPIRFIFTQMLKQDAGRIFFIGSRPGLDSKNGKGMIAYSLSKSLLFRLAELMNAEAKGKNVVASVVVPSTIDTPINRKSMPDADPSKWVKPEAIADVIHFYCTDKASVLREPIIKVYNNS